LPRVSSALSASSHCSNLFHDRFSEIWGNANENLGAVRYRFRFVSEVGLWHHVAMNLMLPQPPIRRRAASLPGAKPQYRRLPHSRHHFAQALPSPRPRLPKTTAGFARRRAGSLIILPGAEGVERIEGTSP
jgi:hypothetical protein